MNLSLTQQFISIALRSGIFIIMCSLCACDPASLKVQPTQQAQPGLGAVQTQLIIPWHEEFARANKQLAERLERFCQNPANPGEYQEVRSAWRASFLAWQPISLLNFGPSDQEQLRLHIYFWPDEFNWVEKHINQLLSERELGGEITNETLGLAELEYFLFDTAFTDSASLTGKPCDFMRAASSQLNTVATNLLNHWQQGSQGAWQTHLLTSGSLAERTAQRQLAKSIHASFTRMAQENILAPAGKLAASEAKPLISEAWRANLGKTALLAKLKAANALINMGLAPTFTEPGARALSRQLKEDLSNLNAELTNTSGELVFLINSELGRARLLAVCEQLQKITATLATLIEPLEKIDNQEGK